MKSGYFMNFSSFFSGASLQICPQGPTCCTPDMEVRLGHWSSRQYKDAVNNKTNQMATPFSTKASKIHGKPPQNSLIIFASHQ